MLLEDETLMLAITEALEEQRTEKKAKKAKETTPTKQGLSGTMETPAAKRQSDGGFPSTMKRTMADSKMSPFLESPDKSGGHPFEMMEESKDSTPGTISINDERGHEVHGFEVALSGSPGEKKRNLD
jgi:hypothetical protein